MKLLCVELDSGSVARPYGEALQGLGEVAYTGDREEALELVRTRRADLVLLPLEGSNGLVGQIRHLAPTMPIIALGKEDSALAAARASAHGVLGYVVQPNGGDPDPAMVSALKSLVQRAGARLRVDSDRREAQAENLRMRKFYGDVLTSVGQAIVVVDHLGKIRFRNPAAARIMGEAEDSVEGDTVVPILQMLVESLTEGETRHRTIALEEEEQKLFLDVTTSVLRSAAGKASGAVAIVSDRSIEKSLEQQLFHSERLATLGSLLASIAHEINNTLTSITGCAEMGLELAEMADEAAASAKDQTSKDSFANLGVEIRQIFDMVLEAGISCQTIADNMLQYSRQGRAEHRAEQDLNKLVEKTIKVLGKHLGTEKVSLTLQLDPRRPRARIEPSKLQQSLVNLVVNAVHALLDLDVPLTERHLRVETKRDDAASQAILMVADKGPGIPPKRLEKIFQPFFTTKGHGTGLGLYITRRVIEELGGTIDVESQVGVGTTFSICLPLA